MMKLKIILTGIAVAIVTIVVVYAGHGKLFNNDGTATISNKPDIDPIASVEDSVEVIGTPTSDDPWKELKKLIANYYSKSGITYKGMIHLVDDNEDQEKIVETMPFEYTLLNNSYSYRLGAMEIVNNNGWLVAVNHGDSTISLARSSQGEKVNKTFVFDIAAFKRIMLQQKADARVTQLGEEKILTVDNIKDPTIQGYRIYYAPQTHRIHKILLGMARLNSLKEDAETAPESETGPYYYYLETSFDTIRELNLPAKDFHPERKFVVNNNNRLDLTDAYKGYQLLNTTQP